MWRSNYRNINRFLPADPAIFCRSAREGTRIGSGPTTHRHNGEAVGIGTADEGDVADVGGEAGGDREAAAREATVIGENGHQRASIRHPSREEQVLPCQSQRRPQLERVISLLPEGIKRSTTIILIFNYSLPSRLTKTYI